MTYQVRFAGPALRQLNGLPKDAFDALVDRVVILLDEPWNATAMWPGNDRAYRETAFGTGLGFISFHADDTAEVIRIFRIVWAGLHGPRHPAEHLAAMPAEFWHGRDAERLLTALELGTEAAAR